MSTLHTEPLELTRSHNESILSVGPSRWRVTDRRGVALGHIEAVPESFGTRFHAVRFHVPSRSFRLIGAFWSPDEALACLR